MKYYNHDDIKSAIRFKEVFTGSSASGYYDINNNYRIDSYSTTILKLEKNLIYFNNESYSSTTSIIQNMILNELIINHEILKMFLQRNFKVKNLDRKVYEIKI